MKMKKQYQQVNCNNIMQCIFDLNKADIEVFKTLNTLGKSRVEAISKKLKKDRSTVYRSLQKLVSCEICIKETKTIEQGGYYHIYCCTDIKAIKQKMKRYVDEWYSHIENTLAQFEQEKKK